MIGETIEVIRRVQVGEDGRGEPIYDTVSEQVENVLVAPGPLADVPDTARPEGTTVAWSLFFPKTFTGSLRGASVRVRGQEPCKVIGDPQPYPDALTPTDWNMPAEAARADG